MARGTAHLDDAETCERLHSGLINYSSFGEEQLVGVDTGLQKSIRANELCLMFVYRASLFRMCLAKVPLEISMPGLLDIARVQERGQKENFKRAQCLAGCTQDFLEHLAPFVERKLIIPGQCLIHEGTSG